MTSGAAAKSPLASRACRDGTALAWAASTATPASCALPDAGEATLAEPDLRIARSARAAPGAL